jgi:adenine-specific DNA-methyltransferase
LPSAVETTRLHLSRSIEAQKKSKFGQFFTPERTAEFMAELFREVESCDNCRLLDAGAGIGSLSAAFLDRWKAGSFNFQSVNLDAFEVDSSLHSHLSKTLDQYQASDGCAIKVWPEDFIHAAVDSLAGNLFAESLASYTHIILNPPYKKINSLSQHRLALRRVGIETVNLYSAFVALAVALAAPGGQIVAIIPRSFCNGPYYKPFRDLILKHTAIQHIHLFKSRDKAFRDDNVLQENIIIRLERDARQESVTISTSTDDTFSDQLTYTYPFEQIVFPNDSEHFIHVPTSAEQSPIALSPTICYTLADLGIQVSTGPVVDFRLKEHLRDRPEQSTVPLLYPIHFSHGVTTWPIIGMKKPNAIVQNADTAKWLYPNGSYCVVRRFSSKEEKRRIMASVVDPEAFPDVSALGFENHLNVFHENKQGLSQTLAHGLAVFLNTTAVDENFRRFNGHTQVNATDLKRMKYPSRDNLIAIGEWAIDQDALTQSMIDAKLASLL